MSDLVTALCSGRVLLMDGAMGTELQRAGLKDGECPEAWNVTHPDRVLKIHRAYVDAGAEVLLANTFQANPPALARHGMENRLDVIFQAGLALARTALGDSGWVLADVGPFAPCEPTTIQPILNACHAADALLLETFSDPADATLFTRANQSNDGPQKPVLLSFTFRRHGPENTLRTFKDFTPERCAKHAASLGVAALGVNCGRDIGMDDVAEILRRYRQATDLPLFARPNAGTPSREGNGLAYLHTPESMAARLPELLQAGAVMIGGCCGTTPAHIAAFWRVIESWNAKKPN